VDALPLPPLADALPDSAVTPDRERVTVTAALPLSAVEVAFAVPF
jgi:hypothetical protein